MKRSVLFTVIRFALSCMMASLLFLVDASYAADEDPEQAAKESSHATEVEASQADFSPLTGALAKRDWPAVEEAFRGLGPEVSSQAFDRLRQGRSRSNKEEDSGEADDNPFLGFKDYVDRKFSERFSMKPDAQKKQKLALELTDKYLLELSAAWGLLTAVEKEKDAVIPFDPAESTNEFSRQDWLRLAEAFPYPIGLESVVRLGELASPNDDEDKDFARDEAMAFVNKAQRHFGAADASIARRIRSAVLLRSLSFAERARTRLPPLAEVVNWSDSEAMAERIEKPKLYSMYVISWATNDDELFSVPLDNALTVLANEADEGTEVGSAVVTTLLKSYRASEVKSVYIASKVAQRPALADAAWKTATADVDKKCDEAIDSLQTFLKTDLRDQNGKLIPLDDSKDANLRQVRASLHEADTSLVISRYLSQSLFNARQDLHDRQAIAEKVASNWLSLARKHLDSYASFDYPTPISLRFYQSADDQKKIIFPTARREAYAVGKLLKVAPSDDLTALLSSSLQRSLRVMRARLLCMEADFAQVIDLCAKAAEGNITEGRLIANYALDAWKAPIDSAGHSPEARTRMADQRPKDLGDFLGQLRRIDGLKIDDTRSMQCFAEFCIRHRPLTKEDMQAALPALAATPESLMRQFVLQMHQLLLRDLDATAEAKAADADAVLGDKEKVAKAKTARAAASTKAAKTSDEFKALDEILGEWRRNHPGWLGAVWRAQIQFAWANHQLEYVENPSIGANTDVKGYEDHIEGTRNLMKEASGLCRQSAKNPDGNYESLELLQAWFIQMYQTDAERATKKSGDRRLSAEIVTWLDRLPDEESAAVRKALSQHLLRQLFTPGESGAYARPKDVEIYHFVTGALQVLGKIQEANEFQRLESGYRTFQKSIIFSVVPDGSIYRGTDWAGNNPRTFPVGRGEFGVWLTLQHTKEARRLSGGFRRYSQNQIENPGTALDARAVANYANDMKNRLTTYLEGDFSVVHVEPLPIPERLRDLPSAGDSWEETPLFYVVLKPDGDVPRTRIPSLPMDLNFIDDAGLVVLPFSSQPVNLDPGRSDDLVLQGAEVKQRLQLNKRNIADGTVVLQLDVTSLMLPPRPEEVFSDLYSTDFGKADSASGDETIKVAFERGKPYAQITRHNDLKMRWHGMSSEGDFRFPTGQLPHDVKLTRLVWWPGELGESEGRAADPVYPVQGLPRGSFSWRYPLWGVGAMGGAALLAWLISKAPRGTRVAPPAALYQMPPDPTYLSSVYMLRRIAGDSCIDFSQEQRARIEADIRTLEEAELSVTGNADASEATVEVLRRWVIAANDAEARISV